MPLILVIVVGLLWLLAAGHGRALGLDDLSRRGALVVAFALFQVLLVLITEGSSAFHAFTTAVIASAWCVVIAVLVFVLRGELVTVAAGALPALRAGAARLRVVGRRPPQLAAVLALLGAFAVLAVIAWVYPPNNLDSLVYHLTRVAHWIQNRTVAAYATHYLHEVEFGPLQEYNMAHLQLLAGTDRLDGYVQLFATLICVVGVSELARRLGLGPTGQLFAALVCATTPSLILEATSTTNSNFSAAIGLAAVLVAAPPWPTGSSPRPWLQRGAWIGCLGALSWLAKGPVIPLVWPCVALLAVIAVRMAWRRVGARPALRGIAYGAVTAALAAALVAGPFLERNVALFGGPTGPETDAQLSTHLTPAAAAANLIRDTASEFLVGDGRNSVPTVLSRAVVDPLRSLYDATGVNPANTDYTAEAVDAFAKADYTAWDRNEDYAPDPLQVCLMILALVLFGVGWARGGRELRLPFAAAIALCVGYIAFSAVTKWHDSQPRYYLPLFVLWSPLIALAMRRLPRFVAAVVALVLVVAILPALFNNAARSLLHPRFPFPSELDAYYAQYAPPFAEASAAADRSVARVIAASSCRSVGIANWIVFEYPLWPALHDAGWRGTLDDVDVTNQTRRLEPKGFRPCALLSEVSPGMAVTRQPGMVPFRFGDLALVIDSANLNARAEHNATG